MQELEWKHACGIQMKACKQQHTSLHLDCPVTQTDKTAREGAGNHADLRGWSGAHRTFMSLFSCGIVDAAPAADILSIDPRSPSAFSVSWKMIPAHWLNFIPSWPGPFCEGAINLELNTTFVYYSGKALMTFMSMITTFVGRECAVKAKIHCDQTHALHKLFVSCN